MPQNKKKTCAKVAHVKCNSASNIEVNNSNVSDDQVTATIANFFKCENLKYTHMNLEAPFIKTKKNQLWASIIIFNTKLIVKLVIIMFGNILVN